MWRPCPRFRLSLAALFFAGRLGNIHSFGTPIIRVAACKLEDFDAATAVSRPAMIAQDTGTAIVGPARGDLVYRMGSEAGTSWFDQAGARF